MQDTMTRVAEKPRRTTLAELEGRDEFCARHIGPDDAEQAAMLEVLGYVSRAALIDAAVPAGIRDAKALDLAAGRTETGALSELRSMAAKNQVLRTFIGQGYYGTHLPGAIQRNILENPAWYTAYTPYQAEIAQGRLEALINFQTMVCDLTGMGIANASMLDEASAAAVAMALCRRSSSGAGSKVFFVADSVLPQTLDVVRTRAEPLGIEVKCGPAQTAAAGACFGALLQYPGANGEVEDYRALVQAVHARGGLVAVAADLLALTLLSPPGEWGADVVLGSAQRFGLPLGYGGPHAAYFATRDELRRNLPGRLVGVSIDSQGNPAYRLALQTREQHIRREKATSNICTAQVLLAVIAGMYAVYHGPRGLTRIAQRVHRLTGVLAAGLKQMGMAIENASWFDTLTLATGTRTQAAHLAAAARGVNLRHIDRGRVGVSLDETSSAAEVKLLWEVFAHCGESAPDFDALERGAGEAYPAALRRSSGFLAHPVFNRHHSETAMLRYLRQLADRDLALDRAMIPLGSCTMKLNATSEMLPISWPEFAHIHPFAPAAQTAGYGELIASLERSLCAITGYTAVSLQPNAGSQGEFAGLLVIRAWHRSRGEHQRSVCLIPASAHGTNPASAHMAGMQVVLVACDSAGNVDLADLRAKAAQHGEELAAIMVTYPSTHGVFEPGIGEICDIVHSHGGQVYIDGANLNAMAGLCAPGHFGGDLSHLNLHKTFGIPHGGGGPGVGPLAVAAHLAPFLPGHRELPAGAQGAVAAAPYGSAGILPVAWMYIAMLGREGVRAASETAILNANYVARRLAPHYPVLYSGQGGLVAHECVLDLRPLKEASGIGAEDVAKRLMDYGFHAPTMSFPVPGTLMVEPTESESKAELDRFIEAMIAIRGEIRAVAEGRLEREDNPLRQAPHTAAMVCADLWPHAYARELAAYPLAGLRNCKYWPPVGRADNAYGDRNLYCRCVPADA
ncbi:MAG: aminomethyl-transferring glycine dehydrogenase [Burkholderiales bacterium]|nr:aminomethyl-transferring glycine dehydrogenase [Burkholderiales bacterium]